MKKNSLLLIFSLLVVALHAQEKNSRDKFTQRIQSYISKAPVIYPAVFLNQSKYAAGDTIFFKAHLLDGGNRPVKGRAILEMALFNSKGTTVEKILFNAKDGTGYSQMVVPDTLTSGHYRLQVYSDWMRNFGGSTFFEQEINVVGKGEIAKKPNVNSVKFFVEGGKLVHSVPNKVVAITTLKNQKWVLTDDKQQAIVQFATDERGIGSLVFTPQLGTNYAAKMEGEETNFPFPEVASDGLAVLLTPNAGSDPVRVLMAAPKNSSLRKSDLSVLLISDQEIQYSAAVNLADKEAVSISISQKQLPEGITQLLVTDDGGNLVAQRCFLVQDRDSLANTFKLAKSQYNQREFVRLDGVLADGRNNRLMGDFSVSVVNKNLFTQEGNTFATPGNVNHIFSDRQDGKNWTSLNNELISFKGFYDWAKILKTDNPVPEHPLRTLIYKSGKAVFKTTGEPVPDSTVLTVYLQRHFMGYEALVEKNGNFDLAFLFDFFGKDELFYVAEHKGKLLKDVVIGWKDEAGSLPQDNTWTETEKPDSYSAFRAKNKLVVPSYNFFTAPVEKKNDALLTNPNAEFEDEFMGADVTVNVEDYVIFPTMEELIREVVPSLQHRKVRGNSTVRVVYSVPSIMPTGDPVYIIDGVMTKRTDFFLSLKPADILIVKIEKDLNKLTRLGAIGKNGIVFVQTKRKEIAEQLRKENTIIPILGLSKPIARKNLNYENAGDWRKPDFRSTIFWNPSIKADASGEATVNFYVGDDVGPLRIKVNGFTEDGRPFSYEQDLEVTFSPAAKK